MKKRWLQFILRFSSFINSIKTKLINSKGIEIIGLSLLILILEIINTIISLPSYLFLSSQLLETEDKITVKKYKLRRVVSLSVLSGFVVIVILINIFGLSFNPGNSYASGVYDSTFDDPLSYTYEPNAIQVTSGMAILKTQDNSTSCSSSIIPIESFYESTISAWTGFTESANKPSGEITYQISDNNGVNWLYFSNGSWDKALSDNDSNTADIVNSNISLIPVNNSGILFKAIITSDCLQENSLLNVSILFDSNTSGTLYDLTDKNDGMQFSDSNGNEIKETTGPAYVTHNSTRVAYIEVHDNTDLTSSIIEYDGEAKTLASIDGVAFNATDTFEILVRKTNPAYEVRICKTVTFSEITANCPDGLTLSVSNPQISSYTLVKTDDTEYWHIKISSAIEFGALEINSNTTCSIILDQGVSLSKYLDDGGIIPSDYLMSTTIKLENPGPYFVKIREKDKDNSISLVFENGKAKLKKIVDTSVSLANGSHVIDFDPQQNDIYNLKVQAHNTEIRIKWWPINDTEPTTWNLYASDTDFISNSFNSLDPAIIFDLTTITTCFEDDSITILDLNSPPQISKIEAKQRAGTGLVDISFYIADSENDYVYLPTIEYSVNGTFDDSGVMTLATNDPLNEGTTFLSTTNDGELHQIVWDAKEDLSDTFTETTKIKLSASDGIEDGEMFYSETFSLDLKNPFIFNLNPNQTPNTETVVIPFSLNNIPTNSININIGFSYDNDITWEIPAGILGDIGDIGDIGLNEDKMITWNVGSDLPNTEINVGFKIDAFDFFNNNINNLQLPYHFSIDTRAPIGLNNLTGVSSDKTSILWNWSPVTTENNFKTYTLWYGTSSNAVTNMDPLNATSKDFSDDPTLGIMGTNSFITDSLMPGVTYYALITAKDNFGHISMNGPSSFSTQTKDNGSNNSGTTTLNNGVVLIPEIKKPPIAPMDGFKIFINNGEEITQSNKTILNFSIGKNTKKIALSNNKDMHDAVQIPITNTVFWDICKNTTYPCRSGLKTVYARFYTENGIASEQISDSITYNAPIIEKDENKEIIKNPTSELSLTKESPLLLRPKIESISTSPLSDQITFTGTSIPNTSVVLFIHSDQVVVYKTKTDKDGNWMYKHSQNDVLLAPGDHEVFAVTYDDGSKIKSKVSEIKKFEVKEDVFSKILRYLDLPTTLLTLFVLICLITYMKSKKEAKGIIKKKTSKRVLKK
jgi:hypothetical protein